MRIFFELPAIIVEKRPFWACWLSDERSLPIGRLVVEWHYFITEGCLSPCNGILIGRSIVNNDTLPKNWTVLSTAREFRIP